MGEAAAVEKSTKKKKEDAPTLIDALIRDTLEKAPENRHVIFLDPSSLERALTSTSKPRTWPTSSEEPSGLAYFFLFTIFYAHH